METVKIQSIKQIGEGFRTENGELFTFGIVLEDGRKVVANAKSTNPWWKAGESAQMILKNQKTKNGSEKVSFKRPDDGKFAKKGATRGSEDTTRQIQYGRAINGAITVLCASELRENGLNPDTFMDQVYNVSSDIIRAEDRLVETDKSGGLKIAEEESSEQSNESGW